MRSEAHIGEAAELYATGHLDELERMAVDRHVAGCNECLRRLGEAEETVLALELGNVASAAPIGSLSLPAGRRGISPWWLLPAIAAAFVLGLLLPGKQPARDAATLAMIGSHFAHSQFAGSSGAPAKVIYARDGAWYYVIVAGAHRYAVSGERGATVTELGVTQPQGQTSALFVRAGVRFERLQMSEAGAVIETAAIR